MTSGLIKVPKSPSLERQIFLKRMFEHRPISADQIHSKEVRKNLKSGSVYQRFKLPVKSGDSCSSNLSVPRYSVNGDYRSKRETEKQTSLAGGTYSPRYSSSIRSKSLPRNENFRLERRKYPNLCDGSSSIVSIKVSSRTSSKYGRLAVIESDRTYC